jgi:hypothetical protein
LQFYTSDSSSPTAGVGAYVAALAEIGSPDTALILGTRDNAGGGVDANERMRITSAGNVGIGTNTVLDGRLNVQVDATNNISLLTYRTAFTANSGYSAVSMWMNDSAATPVVYGALVPNITVNTAGAHSGSVSIYTTSAGTLAEKMRVTADGKLGIGTASPAVTLAVSATDAILVPAGTTAQRPTGAAGYIRYNSTLSQFEGYTSAWGAIGGGATGGGGEQVFWENETSVDSSYTITTGKNAGTFGPISIASGVTVTVPTGSTWSIV